MHAVRTTDDRCELELIGALLQHSHEFLQILAENRVRLFEQIAVGGIDHIGGGQTVVNPLTFFAQGLTHRAGEGHDVMPCNLLNLVDTIYVKRCLLTKFDDVLLGHNP